MSVDLADPARHADCFVELIDVLRHGGRSFATAESLTGGLLSAAVAANPGAGEVFLGGVVSYAREVKRNVLDVPRGPVVSAQAAEAMALGVARLLGADVAVSLTGVAGPEPQDGQEPGTVFVAVAVDGEVACCEEVLVDGDPDRVRAGATAAAAKLVVAALTS